MQWRNRGGSALLSDVRFGFEGRRRVWPWAIILICAAVLAVSSWWLAKRSDDWSGFSSGPPVGAPTNLSALEERERRVAETVWAKELMAQECGRTIDALWDTLNATTNKLRVAAEFPVGEVVLCALKPPQALPHGIALRASGGRGPTLSGEAWRRFVAGFEPAGWRLDQTEFRHNRFDTDAAGQPRQSGFYFTAHLTNPALHERAILVGDLVVDWQPALTNGGPATVARIDASGLTIKTRRGEPWFQPILTQDVLPDEQAYFIDPLILHDLDGDGLSEIILAVKNVVYRRRADGGYEPEPLCRHSPGLIFTGLVADFDGDGRADFLCARADGLLLFNGSARGTFDEPGRSVWRAPEPLKNVMAITCGDIDHDGDLDVFIGQYRVPLLSQTLRPHYYDANDGHPSYLLLNDGQGNFTDATVAAGLGPNRWRRTFSASFADLNQDGDLDLVVVSDFSGLALYENDGRGHFSEVTRDWVAERHAFGMSQTLADFNADGRLDLLMIGMNSPTVDRLEHLGLVRSGAADDPALRRQMAYGNRLYLARPEGGFAQTALNESIARTGWSWGCSAFDLDNDGFPDVYLANGHQTKQSVREYEPEFWLHDLYVEDTISDVVSSAYFISRYARTRGQGWSYGGYEKNRLLLNQQGASFVEIGHLAGVALEEDSRNVVSDDLDGDGRLDLLVTTFEAWPDTKQTLRIYRNTLAEGGHWIGFRFPEEAGGRSPVGVRVTLHDGGRTAVRTMVAGDGFRSQHANTVHFGLGESERVDRVEVHWPDGRTLTLREPAVNAYHRIVAPSEGTGAR